MTFLRLAGLALALATSVAFANDASVRIYPRPIEQESIPKLSGYDSFSLISNSLGLNTLALPPRSSIAAQLVVPPKAFAPEISSSVLFLVDAAGEAKLGDFVTEASTSLEIVDALDNLDTKFKTVVNPTITVYSDNELNFEVSAHSIKKADVVAFIGDQGIEVDDVISAIEREPKFSTLWEEIRKVIASMETRANLGKSSAFPDIIVFHINGLVDLDETSLSYVLPIVNALIDSTTARGGRISGAAIFLSKPQESFHAWVRRQTTTPVYPDGVFPSLEACNAGTNKCNNTYLGFECELLAVNRNNISAGYGCRSGLGKYHNKTSCEFATNNCTSHGSCVEASIPDRFINKDAPQKLFQCRCVTKAGTHFSGSSCESMNITPQFNILVTVTLIFFFVLVVVIVTTCTATDDSDLTILGGSTGRAKTD